MANIKCGKCKNIHTSVNEVRACHAVAVIINRVDTLLALSAAKCGTTLTAADAVDLTPEIVESFITFLITQPDYAAPVVADENMAEYELAMEEIAADEIAPATEGMYRMNGRIFKVQRAIHGSGHLYAKELTENGFEFASGMVRHLNSTHKMTLAQAKEYGALYGTCCACGIALTDERSIAAGIGPICATKF